MSQQHLKVGGQRKYMTDEIVPVLMKSKERVQKHGEVFTPQWIVEKMLAIPGIKEKTEDVFATFLEPSAGEGAFLLNIEDLKLKSVTNQYEGAEWERYALWALSSIYGIEFLEDNLAIARQNMLDLFLEHAQLEQDVSSISTNSDLYKSAKTIIWANIVQGNTLTHLNKADKEITFSHWEPTTKGNQKVQRSLFTYSSLFPDVAETSLELDFYNTPGQLDLFDVLDVAVETVEEPVLQEYKVVEIDKVWKETVK